MVFFCLLQWYWGPSTEVEASEVDFEDTELGGLW